jgi:hypothetical protein
MVINIVYLEGLTGFVKSLEEQCQIGNANVRLHVDHETEDLSCFIFAVNSQKHFGLGHLDVFFVLSDNGLETLLVELLLFQISLTTILKDVIVVKFDYFHK